jgi:hypothetical protein
MLRGHPYLDRDASDSFTRDVAVVLPHMGRACPTKTWRLLIVDYGAASHIAALSERSGMAHSLH